MAVTLVVSSTDSQLTTAPSASRPANRSMPSRKAATTMGGAPSGIPPGALASRNPATSKLSYDRVTFSPVNASRKNRTVSRTRA